MSKGLMDWWIGGLMANAPASIYPPIHQSNHPTIQPSNHPTIQPSCLVPWFQMAARKKVARAGVGH